MSEPQAKVDTPRFLELVVLSGLLSEEQVQAFTARYPADQWQQLCSKANQLADEFVAQYLLTQWQAYLLLAGKYKGFMLGKYKLLQLLGSGGMSSVYLAEHTILGRQVAIKVLPRSMAEDSKALAIFINSARSSASIYQNKHFFHPYDIDNVGITYFIVMDYEPGKSLHSIVHQQGPLDYLTAANYIAQAANGLDALHTAQLIHVHVDPEHLYLTESGVIKILGTSIFWGTEEARQHFARSIRETLFGSNTEDYQSPELAIAFDRVGPQSDIYSLGCVFYFLLTSHAPFAVGTTPVRIHQHMREAIVNLRDERPDAPPRLIEILERMLAKEPSDRYASAGVLYRDLDDFLRDVGGR